MPRTLAFGDIHGCLTALDTLLGFLEPAADDELIFLGDMVDRGPDTRGVIARLIELRASRKARFIRGNHEIMMLAAREGLNEFRFWARHGGIEALDSYARPNQGVSLKEIPAEHWQFLEETRCEGHETATHIFVHANLHPEHPLAEQSTEWLHWHPLLPQHHRPHQSGKTMICGHTQQRTGLPLVLERAICIDTWAYGDGWLTCLDVQAGEFWQANELGAMRRGILRDGRAEILD